MDNKVGNKEFKYIDIRFADIQMLRYRVDEFEKLSLREKCLVYCLSEAALWGRDILWDQNCRVNLSVRRMLEAAYRALKNQNHRIEDDDNDEVQGFATYLRRVWFANGIHHHYSMDKFKPEFREDFMRKLLLEDGFLIGEDEERAITAMFNPNVMPKRVNQAEGEDLLLTSSMNYYGEDVTQREAEDFYERLKSEDKRTEDRVGQPMYGLNSRLEHDGSNGELIENVYRTNGLYGEYIKMIVFWLQKACEWVEDESQLEVIKSLIEFYQTGDLCTFDRYTIQWVRQLDGNIDFINGFTEVYGDPLGLKASWEGYVNILNHKASERTRKLCENAQWFEDHSPVNPCFRKSECRGVSAKVVEAAILGGDLYPASAIGINLPNSNWVRQEVGSKSVTLGNLTHAYNESARGNGFLEEFVIDEETLSLLNRYDDALDDLHTDLHECLGHGSGRMLPGVDPDALGVYGSTVEEARADLFALYYIADRKLLELGLVPNCEAYKSQYYSYMMNALLTQLARIEPGCQIEEAHMRNRALIARWVMEDSGAMQLVKRDGKTYLQINDYESIRRSIAKLLAEVQRIKSEGDANAARRLVEGYGVSVDSELHDEILLRYHKLDLAPYKGFINPRYTLVHDDEGNPVDIKIDYDEDFDDQMLRYGKEYSLFQS